MAAIGSLVEYLVRHGALHHSALRRGAARMICTNSRLVRENGVAKPLRASEAQPSEQSTQMPSATAREN